MLDPKRNIYYCAIITAFIVIFLVGLSGCTTDCSKDQAKCGSTCYDPTIGQSCCNGVIYHEYNQTCCNGSINNISGQCCGNVALDFLSRQSCCNDVIYNDWNQSCCNGQVYSGGWSECNGTCREGTWTLCGSICYKKYSDQSCCNNKLFPKEGWWQPCGNTCYDQNTQSCCGDKIIEGKSRCCKFVKDPDYTICPLGQQCCPDYQKGAICFDPSIYVCNVK